MTATSFELERSVDGISFGPLAQPAGTARQFDDSMQVRGTRYWYRVRANTSGGPQGWSNVVQLDGVPAAGNNAWRTTGGDIGHTGYNALEQGRPPLSLRWTAFGTAVDPVVVDGDRVYAVTYQLLTALDATDGGVSWTHPFPGVHSVGQPAVFDGQVYVAHCNHSSDTKLWSFNPQTGSTTWSVAMSAQWEKYWAPIKVGNGVYTNGGSYGGLYGFDAMSGANLFFNSMLAQYDEWSPASDGNLVYTFVAGIFRAHHPQTGAVQWQTNVTWNWQGWSALTSPVIANGMAYVIAPPNLHAIDLSTRTVRWTASGLNFRGTPAVANGVVYAVSAGNVRAHDASTGAFLWTFVGDGALSYPPVLTQTHLYASSDTTVFAADLATHASVWSAPGGGSLSLANGSLYVAGRMNGLRAYSLTP